jgi:GNAT superfamily N-acetyltransferase
MNIEKMTVEKSGRVFEMMRVFYDSPALIHKSSDAVLKRDIEACLSDSPFVEGYVFTEKEEIIGYSMVSKSFTTEYGGICVWIEDLYFEEKWRNRGFGSQFFEFLERQYPEAVRFKLEVEKENEAAVATYKNNGYAVSDYFLMTKEIDRDE